MKSWLIAGMAVMTVGDPAVGGEPRARSADIVEPAPLVLVQRRSTPDTSTPGSTAPGNPIARPNYVPRRQQYYAAELRRCEAIGESAERLACKNSVRSKFEEM